jgi:general secretion pathway protein D
MDMICNMRALKNTSKKKFFPALVAALVMLPCAVLLAQAPRRAEPAGGLKLKFSNAPMDMVLDDYSARTGRTLLVAPGLSKANITLRSQGDLTMDEYLQAIETVLGMNGVAVLKEGDKFLRVVSIEKARTEPMKFLPYDGEKALPETSELVSQMIPLTHIAPADAQKVVEPLKHTYGQVHLFEGINSILVTDASATLNRIAEVLKMVDQPMEAREEPIIIPIHFAKATDVKQRLEEMIADQQKDGASTIPQQRLSGPPGVVSQPGIPGLIRPGRTVAVEASAADVAARAERGLLVGKVKIVADERTNVLILLTRRENMVFFEKIIKVLDVETSPDVIVKVFRLEYATAEDIATILNDLIGATTGAKSDAKPGSTGGNPATGTGESSALRDYIERRQVSAGQSAAAGKSKVGQLSKDNIKILADKRTNAVIIMGSKNDVAAISEIIKDMDMMLSQVLIEAVILQISLTGDIKTGIDWVQRSMTVYDQKHGEKMPVFAFAGGGGAGKVVPGDATAMTSPSSLAGSGLTYFMTYFGLNVDMVAKLVETDSRGKIIASPVIVTHDNTEAKIDASTERYFYKGQTYVGNNYYNNSSTTSDNNSGGVWQPNVESRKVGLHLKVKPHINERKFVLMEITQQIEELGEEQTIGSDTWPTVLSREMSASIAVQNQETIILGGLVKQNTTRSRSGIPILSRIPVIGLLFGAWGSSKSRDEIVVFITPYVLNSPDEISNESARRRQAIASDGMWERGWSQSKLADPEPRSFWKSKKAGPRPMPAPAARPAPAAKPPADITREFSDVESRWGDVIKREDSRINKNLEQ